MSMQRVNLEAMNGQEVRGSALVPQNRSTLEEASLLGVSVANSDFEESAIEQHQLGPCRGLPSLRTSHALHSLTADMSRP